MTQDLVVDLLKTYGIPIFTASLAFIGSLWKNHQDNKKWKQEFKLKENELNQKYDEIKSKYLDILLQKRLETYPKLIEITEELGKPIFSYDQHKNASKELKQWVVANHGGFLVLSKKTLNEFNILKDLLLKNANSTDGKSYSYEHLRKIRVARNSLRGSMIDDISVVKNADLPTTSPNAVLT